MAEAAEGLSSPLSPETAAETALSKDKRVNISTSFFEAR
jgi:hypothetical protein